MAKKPSKSKVPSPALMAAIAQGGPGGGSPAPAMPAGPAAPDMGAQPAMKKGGKVKSDLNLNSKAMLGKKKSTGKTKELTAPKVQKKACGGRIDGAASKGRTKGRYI